MLSKKLRYGLLVLCIAIALGAIWSLYGGPLREGFQYKELNVDFTKEVYLFGFSSNYANPDYSAGYTKEEAQRQCESMGATLATKAQFRDLKDISANWCRVGAWVADDDANLYFPIDPSAKGNIGGASCSTAGSTVEPMSGDTSTNESRIHIRKLPVPASGKGFAACYGVKPAVGSTPGVQFLNLSESVWSYFDTVAMMDVMDGVGRDMVPFQFKPSQAMYAMTQNRFNKILAREDLVANFATNLNTNIRRDADPSTVGRDTEDWSAAKRKSCEALRGVYDDMKNRMAALKAVVAAVKGQASGVYYAKKENMDLQREIGYVCLNLTAQGSPACKRLAEIDYELFYKVKPGTNESDMKVLAALEDLNMQLVDRECEIQRTALKMQTLLENLRCPLPSDFKALFGDYRPPELEGKYYPDTPAKPICTLQDDPEWAKIFEENGDSRFTIRKNIGYVDGESLRKSLEEISPFFAATGYTDLFNTLLNQLSVLIQLPSLNDYKSSDTNVNEIVVKTDGVKAMVNRMT